MRAQTVDLSDSDLDLLQRLEPSEAFLEKAAAAGAEVIPVGPFRVVFGTGQSDAQPLEPLGSKDEAIAALQQIRALFKERGRRPSIEFNDAHWPDLDEPLQAAGFFEREREPLMVCTGECFRPFFSPDVAVSFLKGEDSPETLAAYRDIFKTVMGVDIWSSTEDVREEVERGLNRTHALAVLDSRPAGTGWIGSFDGTAEITRVATLPEARRRGVAASLTSFMVRDRLASGDTLIWLTAQELPAQRLYEKLGFRVIGTRRYYGAPKE